MAVSYNMPRTGWTSAWYNRYPGSKTSGQHKFTRIWQTLYLTIFITRHQGLIWRRDKTPPDSNWFRKVIYKIHKIPLLFEQIGKTPSKKEYFLIFTLSNTLILQNIFLKNQNFHQKRVSAQKSMVNFICTQRRKVAVLYIFATWREIHFLPLFIKRIQKRHIRIFILLNKTLSLRHN